ncbi:PREDICTED: uncharacterized protein LOC106788987 [Polistes canadensis]|uniref:uncharacterized protein LOC106788987 n=1 Tax=Polistes canadensis TaxID=91411 RepID=UPI000718D679|nr:PREDICTED: uncharacterized protein LOC106788987 [Polistes canadensis]
MRKMQLDSLIQTFILTSRTLFLISGLISTVSGAPFGYGLNTDITESKSEMEPWLQPCGTPITEPTIQPIVRHSVHRQLKRIQTQIRIAHNHYKEYRNDIRQIYNKVDKALKGQYRLNWLPENTFAWYEEEIWCLEKGKKAERVLPRLHDGLQRFAVTFLNLRKFELKSEIDADLRINKRNEIMDTMLTEILRILCEVETMMTNLGLEIPTSHKAVIVTENHDWSKEGDLTLLLIQDWGILRLFKDFLSDWKSAFRNATMRGPGTCITTAPKPPMLRPKKIDDYAKKKNKKNPCPKKKKIKKIKKDKVNKKLTDGLRLNFNQTEPLLRGTRLCPRKRLTRKKQFTLQITTTTQSATTITNFE